jgi:hypothetical protein
MAQVLAAPLFGLRAINALREAVGKSFEIVDIDDVRPRDRRNDRGGRRHTLLVICHADVDPDCEFPRHG